MYALPQPNDIMMKKQPNCTRCLPRGVPFLKNSDNVCSPVFLRFSTAKKDDSVL